MKILAIDFNIIMYNCIRLYEEKFSKLENPTQFWNRLEFENEIDKHLYVDKDTLLKIIEIIRVNKAAQLIKLNHQEEIVDWLNSEQKYDLVNIDYKHDLVYDDNDIEDFKLDFHRDSNWVGYLLYVDMLNSCKWLKAPNSIRCFNNIEDDVEVINLKDYKEIENDFDMIFLCSSEEYVPYKFKIYYDMIWSAFGEELIYKEETDD